MTDQLKLMIVAGEASGDGHAARLVHEIKSMEPDTEWQFFGAAGPKMRAEGVEPVVFSDELSIVGLAEIGRALPMFLRAYKSLKKSAIEIKPDAVVLVDFPDFNLKLAKWLKKQGFAVIYYISPQLWAWRKYRLNTVRKHIDLLISILPFEKDWYTAHGVEHVEYVGSPLAREIHPARTRQEFCAAHGLDPSKSIVSLLPGSRHKEIHRILPVMLQSAELLSLADPNIQFVVAAASHHSRIEIEKTVKESEARGEIPKRNWLVIENETYDALYAADAAAVTSGTATLETGMLGTPLVIVYKTSALNYKLLEPLISVEHYGLINLIAGERLAAELIQDDLTAESLKNEIARLLEKNTNVEMRGKLRSAAEKLGHGGASKRAAQAILNLIRTGPAPRV